MAKALHDYIYVLKDGKKPMAYDRRFADFLIEGANQHIQELKDREQDQIELDKFIYDWMVEYEKHGASVKLLNALNYYLSPVGHQCHLQKNGEKLNLVFVAHIPHKPHPAMFVAYMFSNMTSRGWLEGLKRCASTDCQQFFIGRSNVKWCSKSCGSRSRVKKMRKKNRSQD